MMLTLQDRGCHNINFVTPEHVVPQILEALPSAIEDGLRLPIVCNISSYDSLDSLRLMDGIVDIYLEPPYLHPPVTASVRFGVSAVMVTLFQGWLSLLPVPLIAAGFCERAAGSQGRAAPAQQSREVKRPVVMSRAIA